MSISNLPVELRRVTSQLTKTQFFVTGDRFHLLLLDSGSGLLKEHDRELPLERQCIVWLPRGRGRRIIINPGSRCILTSITDSFLITAVNEEVLGKSIQHSIGFIHIFQELEEQRYVFLQTLVEQIENELKLNRAGMDSILSHAMSILTIELWRLSGADLKQPLAVPQTIVQGFVSLLDIHIRQHWKVGQYADALGVSRDRLTAVIKRATGKTPLELIHHRLIEEAKTLLTDTNQQVAEVAFLLGFTDAAYFNRFFQRLEGITPARFRRKQHRIQPDSDTSFADWP